MPQMIGPSPSTLAATRIRRGFGRQLHMVDSGLLLVVLRVLAARDAWPTSATIARTSSVSATRRSPNGPAYLAVVNGGTWVCATPISLSVGSVRSPSSSASAAYRLLWYRP